MDCAALEKFGYPFVLLPVLSKSVQEVSSLCHPLRMCGWSLTLSVACTVYIAYASEPVCCSISILYSDWAYVLHFFENIQVPWKRWGVDILCHRLHVEAKLLCLNKYLRSLLQQLDSRAIDNEIDEPVLYIGKPNQILVRRSKRCEQSTFSGESSMASSRSRGSNVWRWGGNAEKVCWVIWVMNQPVRFWGRNFFIGGRIAIS